MIKLENVDISIGSEKDLYQITKRIKDEESGT